MKLHILSALLCLTLLSGCGVKTSSSSDSFDRETPAQQPSVGVHPSGALTKEPVSSVPEESTGPVSALENDAGASGADSPAQGPDQPDTLPPDDTKKTESTMKIQAGDTAFTVILEDNSSVTALKELLAQSSLTILMSDYGNMEKVGPIGQDLPRNDQPTTTGPGDVILYQGNSLVIYYGTNSWNFTRIGKIEDVTQEQLLSALGDGQVSVTFSLDD